MKNLKKYVKSGAISAFALAMLLQMGTVNAAVGNWKSSKEKDLNGVSTVETAFASRGNGGDAATFTLRVKYGTGDKVGAKTVGATINQRVEHTCVGQPFRDRYGEIATDSDVSHVPGFNA